jgi:hypothetical protein
MRGRAAVFHGCLDRLLVSGAGDYTVKIELNSQGLTGNNDNQYLRPETSRW